MPNTTSGVAAVALAIDWQAGDQILCFDGEFPANVTPWQQAARRWGAHVQMAPLPDPRGPCEDWLGDVAARLARGVRVLAISAVQFQSGWRAPLAELSALCQRYGTQLAVDGVQAVGCVPLDVTALGIDYLACGSHKWLMGPEGAGFLYIRRERLAALHQTQAGWLSHEDPVAFLLRGGGLLRYDRPIRQRADWLEGGNVAAAACAGLGASVGILLELGIDAIFAHVQAWHDRLEPQLRDLGLEVLRHPEARHRSGILAALPSPGVDVARVQQALADLGVAMSSPDGRLRFSAHWPSPLDETELLARHLAAVLRSDGLGTLPS
jgi:selenocysteine lyase/cysteine desulfurase